MPKSQYNRKKPNKASKPTQRRKNAYKRKK